MLLVGSFFYIIVWSCVFITLCKNNYILTSRSEFEWHFFLLALSVSIWPFSSLIILDNLTKLLVSEATVLETAVALTSCVNLSKLFKFSGP